MSRIGLASCYKIRNYGSVLQALATQDAIEKLGHESISIDYRRGKGSSVALSYLPQLLVPNLVSLKIGNMAAARQRRKFAPVCGEGFERRWRGFAEFVERHIRHGDPVHGREALGEDSKRFDAVVVGSDQVWHPINLGSDFYTLTWVERAVPRISYASSFGVSEIPAILRMRTRRFLEGIDHLSCRETTGVSLIRKLTGREAVHVADPTLLVGPERWTELLELPSQGFEDAPPYLFCYFLGHNPLHREMAVEAGRRLGLKVVHVPFGSQFTPSDLQFGDEALVGASPAEFVAAIRSAKLVLTDSFHGTIFSVLFQRPFFTFHRYREGAGSTNSRVNVLLERLGLLDRLQSSAEGLQGALGAPIDWAMVRERHDGFRDHSNSFLGCALTKGVP